MLMQPATKKMTQKIVMAVKPTIAILFVGLFVILIIFNFDDLEMEDKNTFFIKQTKEK